MTGHKWQRGWATGVRTCERCGLLPLDQDDDETSCTLATIYYTADVFTPDESDTNVYGEPCEPGHGETMESGWFDESWDAWGVHEKKSMVNPDTIETDDPRFDDGFNLDDLIVQDIGDRIGAIDSFDGDSAYAADPQQNYRTGVRVMIAAHVETAKATEGTYPR